MVEKILLKAFEIFVLVNKATTTSDRTIDDHCKFIKNQTYY